MFRLAAVTCGMHLHSCPPFASMLAVRACYSMSYSCDPPQTCMQVEVSLQPWRAFRPDGVILFSDILTPLTGMNIPFDITAGQGPIIADPIRTMEVRAATTRHGVS